MQLGELVHLTRSYMHLLEFFNNNIIYRILILVVGSGGNEVLVGQKESREKIILLFIQTFLVKRTLRGIRI